MHQQLQTSMDEATAAGLYQQYAPALFTYLRMRVVTREDAEDLLIDIFLAALEMEKFWQLDADSQRAWLWRVAHNKVVDHYRHRKRYLVLQLEPLTGSLYEDEEQAPEQSAIRQEEYEQLNESIRQLPELQQQILRLRFVNGLRSPEIASLVGKREGAVRMILSRTLNLLHSFYEKH